MSPKALLQCHHGISLALTPILGKAKSFLAAQKVLYRLFYLAQVQSQLGCVFEWPKDELSLWQTFTKAGEGTLGFVQLQGYLWTLDAADRKWHNADITLPSQLWSMDFQTHLKSLSTLAMAQIHELLMESQTKGGSHLRRKTGSYYTQHAVACALLTDGQNHTQFEGPICDPACGGGVFLMAFAELWLKSNAKGTLSTFLTSMVYGVDINRLSVDLCRMNLWLMAKDPKLPMDDICAHIRWGNALLCPPIRSKQAVNPPNLSSSKTLISANIFNWQQTFPAVFANGQGFRWVVGNPPWIAHAGRAAQPIPDPIRLFYLKRYRAFNGYRSTHGLFCELAAELINPHGGEVAFIVPTSVADLKGYGPTRAAVTVYAQPQVPLSNMGDGVFEGVFQPCMFFRARATRHTKSHSKAWPLKRDDFSEAEHALLQKLLTYPCFPKKTFGERGLQTSGHLKEKFQTKASESHSMALGVGRDVHPFQISECTCWAKPSDLTAVLKPKSMYKSVSIWIRQTAAYPIAVKSPGIPFRNSLLACYSSKQWPTDLIVGLLNSPTLQWFHFQNFRDAREGMPQVKINHLRRYPAPSNLKPLKDIATTSRKLSTANTTPSEAQNHVLHALVAAAYDLTSDEADRIWTWYLKR